MATTKITKGSKFAAATKYDLTNGQKSKAELEYIKSLPATEDESFIEGFKQGERARLLSTNLIGGNHREFAKEFEKVAAQKPKIKEPVHKVSISLKPGEHLETYQWIAVGQSYLKEMGYADSPYLIAQHREKDHEHIHILTSRVDFNGKVVSNFYDENRARQWAMRIEDKYDLKRTPQKAPEKGLSRVEIEQALKTNRPPPKLILQAAIKHTLTAYQESAAFVEALETKSISVMIKTNQQKEILGISFGYADKKFRGSKLGTNYSWQGLQEHGLNYEPQRNYERLEAASRRAVERKSNKSVGSKSVGTNDHALESRTAGVARHSSDASHRDKSERTSIAGLGLPNQSGFDEPAVKSITDSAAEGESIPEAGNRSAQRGSQRQLRRSRGVDRTEVEAVGTVEPQDQQATSAADRLEAFKRQLIIELSADDWFEEQERARMAKLFDRSAENTSLSAETSINSTSLSGTQNQTMDTSANAVVLDGISRDDSGTACLGGMDNSGIIQNDLVVVQKPHYVDDNSALVSLRSDGSGNYIFHTFGNLPDSNERTAAGSVSWSVNLTDGLKAKLDAAEYEVRKTLTIQDDLKKIAEEEKLADANEQLIIEEVNEIRVLKL